MAEKKKATAPAAAVATDKKKALETALAQIEKNYGKGAILRLGDDIAVNVEAIPTGSLSLDLALGIGGVPRGRIVEIYGPESCGKTTLALLPAALVGGLAAFLVYNHHPAKVFMGDTGSLFLGAAVCGLAFALDMPLVLILVGFVYICETLSVILQVTYFKLTHGKRIFKMTPIHHHFELCGWSENKIVVVFASITFVLCIVAFLGVMHRY